MNMSTSSGACSWIGTTDGVVPGSNMISSSNMQSHGGSSTGPGINGGRTPCGACKFLRRKCMKGCVFAPYFLSEQGTEGFCAVHKVFGASNVSKLLLRIPLPEQRCQAVLTIKYEAQARLRDPVYGCVRTIYALERQVERLQAELEFVRAQLMITSSRQLAAPTTLYQAHRQQEMQAAIDNYATLMHTAANPAPASSWCNNNYMYTATSCNPDHWSPSSNSAHNYSSMKGEAEHVDVAAAHYNYDHYLSIMNCTLSDFGQLEALQMASSPDHNMLKLDSLQRSIFSLDPQHADETDLH